MPLTFAQANALFRQDKLNEIVADAEGRRFWPNGADFDPATLHDWPQRASEVAAAVERWRLSQETVA